MNNSLKKSLAGLTLIAIGVAAGWGLSQWRSSTHAVDGAAPQAGAAAERKVLYWYDPMSPTQKFDKPGKSPFMDMDLVPKYADEDAQDSVGLSVSAQTVQALGLRTAAVSCITNTCCRVQRLTHDHVLATARDASARLCALLRNALPDFR